MPEKASEQTIFLHAIGLSSPADRAAYLDEVCQDNARLRADLDGLLLAHDRLGAVGLAPSEPPPQSSALDLPGMMLAGRYQLREPIGEGGMGTVWMAQQTEPVKRLVAVKLVKTGMDSRQVIARFEAERQALALMDHPNIAKVLDAGTTGERPFFVMELVKGVSITKYCDEHRLTPHQRLELFIPVCQAIQHAHQKGIIHRDIKPNNVLVALYDDKPVPKVIDFGVAKATGQELTEQTLQTGFGAVVGTVEYMSPEQASLNQLDVDTRSDIYSLGVLLYELLAGSPPFTHKELAKAGMLEMLRVIREQEPSKPSTKLSTADGLPTLAANRGSEPKRLMALVRGELDWIVMKALEKDRNRRYETANGFALDVQRYLADEPVQACPPSARYRVRKFVQRNKRPLTTATLLGVMLLATTGSVGWTVRDREARQAEADWEKAARVAEIHREVNAAIQEANGQLKQGKWPEASSSAKRAAALLAGNSDPQLGHEMEQLRADLKMFATIEEIRLDQANLKADSFDHASADPAYAAAFQAYGIDVAKLDPTVAAEKIRNSVIRDELVAALDDWAWLKPNTDESGRDCVRVVATLADPDPWRNRFRELNITTGRNSQKNSEALETLAKQAEVAGLPPSTVVQLGRALAHMIPRAERMAQAIALFSAAQERHPSDFWLNTELATLLFKLRKPQDAAGYYRAALAVRPQNPGAYFGLGNALLETTESLDNAISAFAKAIDLKPDYDRAAHLTLGKAFVKKGDRTKAIAAFRKCIELRPDVIEASQWLSYQLTQMGLFEEALSTLQRGRSNMPLWQRQSQGKLPSRYLLVVDYELRVAERLVEFDGKLAPILRGDANPANGVECIGLAKVCNYKQLYGASARFYEDGFRTTPDLQTANRFAAACAAAQAGCGHGKDDPPLDEGTRTRLRKQALEWLNEELAAFTKKLSDKNAKVPARVKSLQTWEQVPELACLRDADALAKLPRAEQEAWRKLWIDVDDLLHQARRKTP